MLTNKPVIYSDCLHFSPKPKSPNGEIKEPHVAQTLAAREVADP